MATSRPIDLACPTGTDSTPDKNTRARLLFQISLEPAVVQH